MRRQEKIYTKKRNIGSFRRSRTAVRRIKTGRRPHRAGRTCRPGEIDSVGGCPVRLQGYSYAMLANLTKVWRRNYILATAVVSNHTREPIRLGDFEYFGFRADLAVWNPLDPATAEAEFHAYFLQKSGQSPSAKAFCDGKEVPAVTAGVRGVMLSMSNLLPAGEAGCVVFCCEVPSGWEKLKIVYTLNGDTISFVLNPMDAVFSI